MSEVNRRLMMLKPMRAGVSGYARLQRERGRVLAQLHLRGLTVERVRAFWYLGGGEAVLLGAAPVNPRGEASLTSDLPEERLAPERIRALLVIGDGRRPEALMIGMYARQDAGHLLDAKNAALALCERLREEADGKAGAPSAERRESAHSAEAHGRNELLRAQRTSERMPVSSEDALPLGQVQPTKQADNAVPPVLPASVSDERLRLPEQLTTAPPIIPPASTGNEEHSSQTFQEQDLADSANPLGQGEQSPAQRTGNPPRTSSPTATSPVEQPPPAEQPAASPLPPAYAANPRTQGEQPSAGLADNPPHTSSSTAAFPSEQPLPAEQPAADSPPPPLPREVFLTAIEPMRPAPAPVSARASAPPADRLCPLRWPKGFEQVSAFFRDAPRFALFPLPGWRFVYAGHSGGPDGLWVGYWQADGRVRQLAYAVRGDHPPTEAYRPTRGLDGCTYQVLWQRV